MVRNEWDRRRWAWLPRGIAEAVEADESTAFERLVAGFGRAVEVAKDEAFVRTHPTWARALHPWSLHITK